MAVVTKRVERWLKCVELCLALSVVNWALNEERSVLDEKWHNARLTLLNVLNRLSVFNLNKLNKEHSVFDSMR